MGVFGRLAAVACKSEVGRCRWPVSWYVVSPLIFIFFVFLSWPLQSKVGNAFNVTVKFPHYIYIYSCIALLGCHCKVCSIVFGFWILGSAWITESWLVLDFSKAVWFWYRAFHFLLGFNFFFFSPFLLCGKFCSVFFFVEDLWFTYLFCVKFVISMEVFMVSAFSAENKGQRLKGFLWNQGERIELCLSSGFERREDGQFVYVW